MWEGDPSLYCVTLLISVIFFFFDECTIYRGKHNAPTARWRKLRRLAYAKKFCRRIFCRNKFYTSCLLPMQYTFQKFWVDVPQYTRYRKLIANLSQTSTYQRIGSPIRITIALQTYKYIIFYIYYIIPMFKWGSRTLATCVRHIIANKWSTQRAHARGQCKVHSEH